MTRRAPSRYDDRVKAEELKDLEEGLERLRAAYEQYFLGIEKRPPTDTHAKLARAIRIGAEEFTPNAGLRFRIQGLKARLITFEQYWTRTLREIENGTYRRQRFQQALKAKAAAEMGEQPPKPRATSHVDLGGEDRPFGAVIDEYRRVQREAGQAQIDPAKLAETLRKQEAQLREKLGARAVEFRVVVEDGKPKLKAKPVK
jgi:hypothetical protein